MSFMLKSYQNFLARFPSIGQAISTGILMGSGDLIAQTLVEGKRFQEIDVVRAGKFTAVGTFFVGPSLHKWYGVMDKFIGSKGKSVAVKKVAVDQLFFAPAFLAAVMAIVNLTQGASINEVKEKLSKDYPDVLKNNYRIWPAVQLFNFYLIPLQYQVLTVQFVAVFWNTYLSWKMN